MGDPGHIAAVGAPNGIENLKLGITGYGAPYIFGSGCKSILCF
jgi:hypothetical protein